MRLLLDTCTAIWFFLDESHKLSPTTQKTIQSKQNDVWISAASIWEIAIKASLGKIEMQPNWMALFEQEMQNNAIQWLPITPQHCMQVQNLPFYHRDPFDRMIIAQALTEHLTVVTSDQNFQAYPVAYLW